MTPRSLGRAAFLLALALPSLAAAQGTTHGSETYAVRLEYRWWWPDLNALIQKGAGTVPEGSILDLTNDLGVPNDHTWEIKGSIKFSPSFKLRGSYTKLDLRGDTIPTSSFVYGTTVFPASTEVLTSVKGGYYSGELELELMKRQEGFFGIFAGAKYLDLDTLIVAPDQGLREQDQIRMPEPSAGLAARIYSGRFSFEGEASLFGLGDGPKGYELEGSVRVHFSDRMAVQGGYRRLSIHGPKDASFVDFKLSGFTAGVELSL